jgi:hypothetical protein
MEDHILGEEQEVDKFNSGREYSSLLLGDAPAASSPGSALDVARSRLEREVSRLDQQWQVERKKHFVTYDEDSPPEPPNASGTVVSIVVGVVAVAFGVYWIAEAPTMWAAGFFPIIIGIGLPIYYGYQYSRYSRASGEYERKREEFIAQMNDVDGTQ